jgi:predicted nucleic acid-binding protein
VVFADSSGFIAAFDSRDSCHPQAARAFRGFAQAREKILTTQLVLAETVTHLRRRAGFLISRQVGDALLRSHAIDVLAIPSEQFEAGWREFLRNPDPKLSLCDAVSFVVMRDNRITRAFTFDHHFAEAGFELVPG